MSGRRGVFLVLLLIAIAVAVSFGSLMLLALAGGAPAPLPSNATLRLQIATPLSETPQDDVLSQLSPVPHPTLRSLTNAIRRAATDTRIKGLLFTPQAGSGLWGQLQEIREALVEFKASGKPLTAYLEYGGPQEYYLASAADRIVLMPAGQLDVTGLASYEIFLRGALDKLGVFPDLLHIGDYKTASNTFTEKGFTPAHREMTQSLNHDWYDHLVSTIAEARKLTPAQAAERLSGGPYLAEAARDAGLVDDLAYDDQLDDTAPIQGTRMLEGRDYLAAGPTLPGPNAGRIALLYATGTIASGRSAAGSGVIGSDTFVEWVRRVRIDPTVKAIVVRIDSPGGSAIASEVMWRELSLAREAKPVVVSMGDVAASGGYYIAAPADEIVAQPGTITGSIGIVTGKYVVDGTLDKLGIGIGTVTDGGMAEIYSPFRPFTPAERARIEDQMHATYDLFVSRVAEGRHRTTDEIDAIGQGRVWTGRQAKDLGLVDDLGGLDVAIAAAKRRAKMAPDQGVDLLVYPARRSLYEVLTNPLG
ncbi:MAG: signal peptide peptidase SppA, partial [Vicinamibacterales bacterium]